MRKTNGITLIALVITIIVLLILAGVSISAIVGENGIVTKAKDAADKTKNAAQEEADMLDELEKYTNLEDNKEEIPDILKRYVLGEDGNGILHSNIINLSTGKFIDNNVITDASTSVLLLNMENNDEYKYGDIKYEDNFYRVSVDISSGYTKLLEKYELNSIYSSNVPITSTAVDIGSAYEKISLDKKYLFKFTVNGEEQFYTSMFFMSFSYPVLVFMNLSKTCVGVLENNSLGLVNFDPATDEIILNNIYEIGYSCTSIEEDGFLLGYVNDERGWALCGTPSGEYVIPKSIGGKNVTCVINDAIIGIPTFSHVVTLPNWGDPIKITEAKVTINDNEFIEHVLNALAGYGIDIDLTECGDSVTFSEDFLRTYGNPPENVTIYVTSVVKEVYADYENIVAK